MEAAKKGMKHVLSSALMVIVIALSFQVVMLGNEVRKLRIAQAEERLRVAQEVSDLADAVSKNSHSIETLSEAIVKISRRNEGMTDTLKIPADLMKSYTELMKFDARVNGESCDSEIRLIERLALAEQERDKLKAAYNAQFKPDWGVHEAALESIREHQQMVKALTAGAGRAQREAG